MASITDLAADRIAAVLIVEDEPLIRAMAADSFMEASYRVFEACDAADAMAILEAREDIGAVFTDIEMPGDMSGLDLAATVRGRWPEIAVLITSGRVFPGEDMLPARADFIAKPYRQSEMVRRLAALMLPSQPE